MILHIQYRRILLESLGVKNLDCQILLWGQRLPRDL